MFPKSEKHPPNVFVFAIMSLDGGDQSAPATHRDWVFPSPSYLHSPPATAAAGGGAASRNRVTVRRSLSAFGASSSSSLRQRQPKPFGTNPEAPKLALGRVSDPPPSSSASRAAPPALRNDAKYAGIRRRRVGFEADEGRGPAGKTVARLSSSDRCGGSDGRGFGGAKSKIRWNWVFAAV